MAEKKYRETFPADCSSGVTCVECDEEVGLLTFDRNAAFGVCACPWTLWMRDEKTKDFFRSTPLWNKNKATRESPDR